MNYDACVLLASALAKESGPISGFYCDECQILIATGVGNGHLSLLGGLLIMDTAVEEDTEEERKMPLAIMQGYMTIIQVNNFKSQVCEELCILN